MNTTDQHRVDIEEGAKIIKALDGERSRENRAAFREWSKGRSITSILEAGARAKKL